MDAAQVTVASFMKSVAQWLDSATRERVNWKRAHKWSVCGKTHLVINSTSKFKDNVWTFFYFRHQNYIHVR